MSDVGFLYALANSSMPGLVKVGKTTRSPTDRAAELSGVTGVATPFMVVYEQLFQDCHFAESFVHAYLAEKGHRVADNREFFNAPVSVVVRAIGLAPGAVDGESLQAESEPMDELIGEAVGDDLDDMQLTPVARTDPWTDIYAEALNHWHGFDNYLKDEVEAVRLFRQAATLGSTEAYTRLGFAYQVGFEGTAADKEKALKYLLVAAKARWYTKDI